MTNAGAGQGPLFSYRARVAEGALTGDPAQELAAEKLQSLCHALKFYRPRQPGSWKERFGLARRAEEPPAGLYIFGDVGRGKSMLMDLFFADAPAEKKRRVHFHEFMLEIHARLHALRTANGNGRAGGRVDDLLPAIARDIAAEAWLLCFDELHVVNIADAMLLGRLFETLFAEGVIVVATSNWPPDALYAGGLQRELFLPFIALIKRKLDVLHLEGRLDYRMARLMSMQVYHVPLGPAADRALDRAFRDLTDNAPSAPAVLEVMGRRVAVPAAAKGVARFRFADLCEQPLGPADFIAIAGAYHTIVLSGIPRLAPERRDTVKRFATLVDVLYERKVKLVCSAAAPPHEIHPAGEHAQEFRRTASRLMEMQSVGYLSAGNA
ncbi:MAG: AFG1 family ATPase [Candidatus Odyssella sp.]|nr:AFG1 family ATPase [Candidatus Odyssella sp.]